MYVFTGQHAMNGPLFTTPQLCAGKTEARVRAENWHEERDRVARLLSAIETGKVWPIDEDRFRRLRAENIPVLKKRFVDLNARSNMSDWLLL